MGRAGGVLAGMNRRERYGLPLMAACAVPTVVSVHGGPGRSVAVGLLFVVAEAFLLSARRIPRPFGVGAMAAAAAAGVAITVLAPHGFGEIPALVAIAATPRAAEGRVRTVAVVAMSVAFGGAIWYISGSPVGLLSGAGGWFLAERTVEQADLQRERDRAVALLAEVEASRDAATAAAASEERSRIAREMHDVLAHSLAGLSLQLQAVRAVAARHAVPPEVTGPLDRAADLAREGVSEARAVVGVLRQTDGLGIEAVAGLVERFPGRATLSVAGTPGTVDAAAGHAAYRAVQEALTNAARYAPGSAVAIEVMWTERALEVRITDAGRVSGHAVPDLVSSGAGLAGMTERIAAAGGTLTAGPDGAGWRVELSVPARAADQARVEA